MISYWSTSSPYIALEVAVANIFHIEVEAHGVFAIEPSRLMFDGEIFSLKLSAASIALMPSINREFEKKVFDQTIACGARIHTELLSLLAAFHWQILIA